MKQGLSNVSESPPRFCFTLDTEPDNLWENRHAITFHHFSRLLDFHKQLVDLGARPTYLTTSEVAEDVESARILGRIIKTENAEIGAHFHTWTRTWPFAVPDLGSPPVHACAHQLGQDLEEHMLRYTCDALQTAFRVRPDTYRGGKWSFNGSSLRSLRNAGIRTDTTITPGLSWKESTHPLASGPDFRDFPSHPFYLRGESLKPENRGDILELPVGASFHPDRASVLRTDLISRLQGKVRRLTGRPSGVYWLRPTLMSRGNLKTCLESLQGNGVTTWVAMIHSSEIIPCKYFPTEHEVERFCERCFDLVRDAIAMGAIGATISEARLEEEHRHEIHRSDFI